MELMNALTSNTAGLIAVTIMLSLLVKQVGGASEKFLILFAVMLGLAFVLKNAQMTHTARYQQEEASIFEGLF